MENPFQVTFVTTWLQRRNRWGYFPYTASHLTLAALALTEPLRVGDAIHSPGHSTDFGQEVTVLQIDHQPVTEAQPGDDVGMKVIQKVQPHDKIFILTDE